MAPTFREVSHIWLGGIGDSFGRDILKDRLHNQGLFAYLYRPRSWEKMYFLASVRLSIRPSVINRFAVAATI